MVNEILRTMVNELLRHMVNEMFMVKFSIRCSSVNIGNLYFTTT